MSNINITPYITSEDISHFPDQAAFKLNTLIDNLTEEIVDRQNGEGSGSDAIQAERTARISNDNNLQDQITALQNSELSLIMSPTDIGEGALLDANTLYGVYE